MRECHEYLSETDLIAYTWVLVVVAWYGDAMSAEALEVEFQHELDCRAAEDRLEARFERERSKDANFGYVIMDCERRESDDTDSQN